MFLNSKHQLQHPLNTADNDVLIVIDTVKEALKSSGKDIQHMDSSTIFRTLTSTNSGIEFTVTPQNEMGSYCISHVHRSHSTLSTISMDSSSDMINNTPPKSQALSEDVSFQALKKERKACQDLKAYRIMVIRQ